MNTGKVFFVLFLVLIILDIFEVFNILEQIKINGSENIWLLFFWPIILFSAAVFSFLQFLHEVKKEKLTEV